MTSMANRSYQRFKEHYDLDPDRLLFQLERFADLAKEATLMLADRMEAQSLDDDWITEFTELNAWVVEYTGEVAHLLSHEDFSELQHTFLVMSSERFLIEHRLKELLNAE